MLLIAQVFPLLLPWYADHNYTPDDENGQVSIDKLNIIIYKKKSRMYMIVSLFSVFVRNHWISITDFINDECPYVMKSGYDCLKMNSFQYASIGVSIFTKQSFKYQHCEYSTFNFHKLV